MTPDFPHKIVACGKLQEKCKYAPNLYIQPVEKVDNSVNNYKINPFGSGKNVTDFKTQKPDCNKMVTE